MTPVIPVSGMGYQAVSGRGHHGWPVATSPSSHEGSEAVLSVLAALQVKVAEVDGLPDPGCWVRSQRVLLIRAGLDDEQREEVLDEAMLAACEPAPTARRRP